jgi:hypothetical protein
MENNSDSYPYIKFINKIVDNFPYLDNFHFTYFQGKVLLVLEDTFVYCGDYHYNNGWKNNRIPQEEYPLRDGQIPWVSRSGISFTKAIISLLNGISGKTPNIPSNFVIKISRISKDAIGAIVTIGGGSGFNFQVKVSPLPNYAMMDKVYSELLQNIYQIIKPVNGVDIEIVFPVTHTFPYMRDSFDKKSFNTPDNIIKSLSNTHFINEFKDYSRYPSVGLQICANNIVYSLFYDGKGKKIYGISRSLSLGLSEKPVSLYENNPQLIQAFNNFVSVVTSDSSLRLHFHIYYNMKECSNRSDGNIVWVKSDLELLRLPATKTVLMDNCKDYNSLQSYIAISGKQPVFIRKHI